MDTWFVFFHLAFSFLFVNALMRMSKFSRVTLICASLCLASYFTLTSPQGTYWQLWASAIVLVHLISWNKNLSADGKQTEILQEDIWSDYFGELSDDSYNYFLENSSWEKLSLANKLSFGIDTVYYSCGDQPRWGFLSAGSTLQVSSEEYVLIMEISKIKVLDSELYERVISLAYSQNQSNIAS
ncbi:hypothetical protein [Halobacteriovorax sp. HLS]|uniref:hypothetical protein n=1 Tax=Halobacteriovorax sp. HLS TaxID=2234000 RepID=UPI000FD747BD|nr:hypothetical protein [Halobacteriovorax sp. HLS]